LIVTTVPTGPLGGENDVISGVPGTVNFVALVPVPEAFVTEMYPVVVPAATVAVICVEFTIVKLEAAVRLNFTCVTPVKLVPLIVTSCPTGPWAGVKDEIVGVPDAAIVKSVALVAVPPGVVTVIFPVCVPLATVAEIWVAESTVKSAAALLPNVTADAARKLVPVITTRVPGGPLIGEKPVIVGAAAVVTVKVLGVAPLLLPVPPGATT
jgi:hypothetical protein